MKSMSRVLASAALLMTPVVTVAETLTVMTSYPEAVVSRFEEAFEQANPGVGLQILWRMPHDALPFLLQPEQGGVDVVWLPSLQTFLNLKEAGSLRKLSIDRAGLPERMGDTLLADPDGTFTATEVAGYGLFVNTDSLARLQLPTPQRWQDLTDPRWRGQVALPVPSKIGFAPMLVDQLLQAEGWQAGWNQWRAIAANSVLVEARGNFITDEVAEGRAAAGLGLDFFAASALASGARGAFIYPRQTAFNPAHIGVTAASKRVQAAEKFVTFVLSDAGQTLLFHPDIRKLPVRPAVYAKAPAGYANPFAQSLDTEYDQTLGLARRDFNSALFDAAISAHHAQLVQLWQNLLTAEVQKPSVPREALQRARQLLTDWPVAEPAADDPVLLAFQRHVGDAAADAICRQAESRWQQLFAAQYSKAAAAIDSALVSADL